MIVHPKPGQSVQLWYNKRKALSAPLHGRVGVVAVVARGPGPRNHGVVIDGALVVVPCGNLRKPKGEP